MSPRPFPPAPEEIRHLKGLGLKVTEARLQVLKLFRGEHCVHLGIDEIHRRLGEGGAPLCLTTVYRVVTKLEEAGLLTRHHFDGGKPVYESSQGRPHDHLICECCGKVEEFRAAEIERIRHTVTQAHDFSPTRHRLTLYGLCSACRPGRSGTAPSATINPPGQTDGCAGLHVPENTSP